MNVRQGIDWSKLASLRLQAKLVADGAYAGAHRSVRRGAGVEFHGHRNYVPGDELRFLDRHAHLRHGMLLIREFETETERSLYLVVDASASMGFAGASGATTKYGYASLLAAALGHIALSRADRVALEFLGGESALPLPSTGGRQFFERLVGHLESTLPQGELDTLALERALGSTSRRARRGAAIVLFSDLLDLPDAAGELMAGLSANGRAFCMVQVLDPVEESFPFEGPVTLYALEGTARVETDAVSSRAAYLRALAELERSYREPVIQRGGRFLRVSSADDPVLSVRRVLRAIAGAAEIPTGAA